MRTVLFGKFNGVSGAFAVGIYGFRFVLHEMAYVCRGMDQRCRFFGDFAAHAEKGLCHVSVRHMDMGESGDGPAAAKIPGEGFSQSGLVAAADKADNFSVACVQQSFYNVDAEVSGCAGDSDSRLWRLGLLIQRRCRVRPAFFLGRLSW